MIKKNHKMWWLRKNLRRRLDSSTVLAIFTLVVMLVSIPISLQFLGRIKEIDRTNITYAEGQNSSLTISASNIVDLTSPFDAIILLNTDSAPIRAVDVVIDYDPTYLDLQSATPTGQVTTSLKTFTPITSNGTFDAVTVISNAKQTKKIKFSALTYDYTAQQNTSSFNGLTQLVILTFKPIKIGTTLVSFSFSPNLTTETNIVPASNPPYDFLSQSSQLINSQIAIVTPTPTPLLEEPTLPVINEDRR